MKTIYIIDALGYIFRAYHALPPMTSSEGKLTNALYGFALQLKKILKTFSPKHIVAVFDGPNHIASRKEIFPDYKANRAKAEEDLKLQMKWASDLCDLMGIPKLIVPNVEADDTIASVATWAKDLCDVYICSHDKDLNQLIEKKITLVNTHKENLHLTPSAIIEKFGIHPSQVVDYLALIGDASDNIPGLAGVGPKTASKWLQEYQDIEGIVKHAGQIQKGKKADLIIDSYEQLLMNRKIITLNKKVDIPTEASFYEKKEEDQEKISEFYKLMRFTTFLQEIKPKTPALKKSTYVLVQSAKELKALCNQIQKAKHLCIDLETTSLNAMEAKIVGVGIATSVEKIFYLPFNGSLEPLALLATLKPLLEEKPLIGHHLKYDLLILANHGIHPKQIFFDTMLASYLLFAHSHRHSLNYLSLEFFDFHQTPIEDLIGKGSKQISMMDVEIEKVKEYCCEDVEYTYRLMVLLKEQIENRKLSDLLKIETDLLFTLLDMENNGIFLDTKPLKEISVKTKERLETIKNQIFLEAGSVFNLNSPKQLAEILFEKLGLPILKKTKTGVSTNVDILTELAQTYPIASFILEYRKLEKLRSTYIEALPEFINTKTGRIHPTFTQTVAATGRLACQNPNLQNIPIRTKEGRELRTCFRPQKEGDLFLSADYSQIELRIVAHLSQDEALIQAFHEDQDIHAFTAHLVYGVPLNEVSKEQRNFAKAVNFGIIYGQSAFGLSKQLQIEVSEAKTFIDAYFERYPKVKKFLDHTIEEAKEYEVTTTILGRERQIKEINSSNAMVRMGANRLAINTPVQGSAADIMKLAMLEIQKNMKKKGLKSAMILQVHDEVIFETNQEEVKELQDLVRSAMETIYPLIVPLKVNLNIGKNWAEC